MNDIAVRISKAMSEKKISYGELNKLTGIPKSALQRYATGETDKIPLDRLELIAEALGVSAEHLIGWDSAPSLPISEDGQHIGLLYDRADEMDKMLTHNVLDKYDDVDKIVSVSTLKKNPGGFVEFDVYDEPAAAGKGNYLSEPRCHREQFLSFMVPKGTSFGVHISGDSMEPVIADKSTVFVKQTMTVENGKVGIFILNGEAFCKQLIVDKEKRQIRLHSINPKYDDIIVTPEDNLYTIGQVL